MKNIKLIMMIMGFVAISACSSNETMDTAESDAKAEAEMMKQEQTAAMEEKQAEAEAAAAAKKAEAEAEIAAKKAEAEAEAEAAAKKAEMEVAAMNESDSGNPVSTCTNGDQVRVITVVYDNDDTDTVCEVTYEKSTGVQTLWTANSDRDYCLDQATAFVEKQEGWGWTCSELK